MWKIIFLFSVSVMADLLPQPRGCMTTMETGICSGKGRCFLNSTVILESGIAGSKCICNSDWTGVGDFINLQNYDCSQNIPFIKTTFSLAIIFNIPVFFLSIFKLFQCYIVLRKRVKELVNESPNRNGVPGRLEQIEKNPSTLSTSFCYIFFKSATVRMSLLTSPIPVCFSLVSFLRLLSVEDERYALGHSHLTTWLQVLGFMLFWTATCFFVHSWLTASVRLAVAGKGREETDASLRRFTRILIVVYLFSLIALLLNFILPFFPEVWEKSLLVLLYCQANTIVYILLPYAIVTTGKRVLQISIQTAGGSLPSAIRTDRDRGIKNILRIMRLFTFMGILMAMLWTLLGWWPWLRFKLSYWFGLSWAGMAVLLFVALSILKPPTNRKQKPGVSSRETPSVRYIELSYNSKRSILSGNRKQWTERPSNAENSPPSPVSVIRKLAIAPGKNWGEYLEANSSSSATVFFPPVQSPHEVELPTHISSKSELDFDTSVERLGHSMSSTIPRKSYFVSHPEQKVKEGPEVIVTLTVDTGMKSSSEIVEIDKIEEETENVDDLQGSTPRSEESPRPPLVPSSFAQHISLTPNSSSPATFDGENSVSSRLRTESLAQSLPGEGDVFSPIPDCLNTPSLSQSRVVVFGFKKEKEDSDT